MRIPRAIRVTSLRFAMGYHQQQAQHRWSVSSHRVLDVRCRLLVPLVEFPRCRLNKCDFVLNPEQGPFAAILACSNLVQAVSVTDLQDKKARNTMALEELESDAISIPASKCCMKERAPPARRTSTKFHE